ncbi:hypothetical protein bAD24_III10915 [Burkholderia sp. AD24]|nr:hypothetical protein bAD24_III10915 [Burkholderia sp. AD24]
MSDAEEGRSALRNVLLGGVVAGIISAACSLASNYYINYLLIEKPKIDDEEKRLKLEGQSQLAQLVPKIAVSCFTKPQDKWTWAITCTTSNTGIYSTVVKISDVSVIVSDEYPTHRIYHDGDGFHVTYLDSRQSYLSNPTGSGDLTTFIVFDKIRFANGIRTGLAARVSLDYDTLPDFVDGVSANLPNMQAARIYQIAHNGYIVTVDLPSWTPAGTQVPAQTAPTSPATPEPASAAITSDAAGTT